MTDLPNRPLPVQLQDPHPEWVKELGFSCWLAADRNASRALQFIQQQWPEHEPQRLPSYRTLASWAQRGHWDAKADELIAENFPGLTMRHTARLVHLAGLALTTLEEVISGDGFARGADGEILFNCTGHAILRDPRHDRNRLDGATRALELAGIGTAGSRTRTAPVVRSITPETRDLSTMSEEELAALQLEVIRKGKSQRPEVQ